MQPVSARVAALEGWITRNAGGPHVNSYPDPVQARGRSRSPQIAELLAAAEREGDRLANAHNRRDLMLILVFVLLAMSPFAYVMLTS